MTTNYNTLTDYDLIPNGHPDFSYDLTMGAMHVASVAQHLIGEEIAAEIGWRMLMERGPDAIVDCTDPIDDEPGDDCPEHGPYDDDDCPKCAIDMPSILEIEDDDTPTEDALTLCIAALTAAQRGVFGSGETRAKIALALAACHQESAALDRIKADVMRRIARKPVDVCRWCGGAHHIQRCYDLLAEAEIAPVRLAWCEREKEAPAVNYSLIAA